MKHWKSTTTTSNIANTPQNHSKHSPEPPVYLCFPTFASKSPLNPQYRLGKSRLTPNVLPTFHSTRTPAPGARWTGAPATSVGAGSLLWPSQEVLINGTLTNHLWGSNGGSPNKPMNMGIQTNMGYEKGCSWENLFYVFSHMSYYVTTTVDGWELLNHQKGCFTPR